MTSSSLVITMSLATMFDIMLLKRDNYTWNQQDCSLFLDQAVTFNSVQLSLYKHIIYMIQSVTTAI